MKILVDADACSVIKKIEDLARKNNIEVELFCDTNHVISSNYSKVRIVGAGSDAVDFAILNSCSKGDIVVTNDGGLASLVLAKKGYVVNSHGRNYTERDIDSILNSRYIMSKAKRRGCKNFKGMEKNKEPHPSFYTSLSNLINRSLIPAV